MSRLSLPLLAVLACSLLAAPLAAQACLGGPADEAPVQISFTVAGRPEALGPVVESSLRARGYTLAGSPSGGPWVADPVREWPAQPAVPGQAGVHPGLQVSVAAAPRADSTELTLSARTLCNLGSAEEAARSESPENVLEIDAALGLLGAFAGLGGAGSSRFQVSLPAQLAEFALAGRHDYPDPGLGSQFRYRGPGGLMADVYVYPGVRADARCTPVCGELLARSAVNALHLVIPELVRTGRVGSMTPVSDEVLRPGPGALWQAGRHLVLDVKIAGQPEMKSHFYVYAFPGFAVKVRSTYPDTAERTAQLQSLVADLLARVVKNAPPAAPPPASPSTR